MENKIKEALESFNEGIEKLGQLLTMVENGFLDEEWKCCKEMGISFKKTKDILETMTEEANK
jgi:hypothetical protein